jgi:hypothetical protein|tara:strand:+ start:3438 stop:3731 length:294 start_codon:yes stop_codon:yes gene_type:complete
MEVITIETKAYQDLIKEIYSLKEAVLSQKQTSFASQQKIYSNNELAAYLKVTPRYLLNIRNKGYIGYTRNGRAIIYTQAQVDEYLANNVVKPFGQRR